MAEAVSKLTGLCRNKGRIDKEKVRAIMKRVAAPAVLYGNQIWGERASDSRVIRHLGAAESKFLLASVRCNRTVASETLRVVNGTSPWHLAAAAAFKSRRACEKERAREDDRPFPGYGLWEAAENRSDGEVQVVWVDASVQDGWTGVGTWEEGGFEIGLREDKERDSLSAEILGIGEALRTIGKGSGAL